MSKKLERKITDAYAIESIRDHYKTWGQEEIFENPSSLIEFIGDLIESTGRQAWFEEPGYMNEGDED